MAASKATAKPKPKPKKTFSSVDVREVKNGYVISRFTDGMGGSETHIAKDKAEMQQITKKLLGIK